MFWLIDCFFIRFVVTSVVASVASVVSGGYRGFIVGLSFYKKGTVRL